MFYMRITALSHVAACASRWSMHAGIILFINGNIASS